MDWSDVTRYFSFGTELELVLLGDLQVSLGFSQPVKSLF